MSQTVGDTEYVFQKLDDTWYVFAEVEGELFYTPCPKDFVPSGYTKYVFQKQDNAWYIVTEKKFISMSEKEEWAYPTLSLN